MPLRFLNKRIKFKSFYLFTIVACVFFISIFTVSEIKAETFQSISILDDERCTQVDVDEKRKLISITALCGPNENEYLFKIWQGNQPLFLAFKEHGFEVSLTNDEKKFEGFELNKINFKQKTFRQKVQASEVLPQIIVYDPLIVEDFSELLRSKKSLEIFLSDGSYFSKITFNAPALNSEAGLYLEGFDLPEQNETKRLVHAFSESYLNTPAPNKLFKYCYPSIETFNEFKFLEKFGHSSLNTSCTATILKHPNASLDSEVFNISYEKEQPIEKLLWAGLLFLDGRLPKNKFLEIASKAGRDQKTHFFNFSSIYGLGFVSNKGEAIKKLIDIFRNLNIDNKIGYYNLLLHLNCSSYQKTYIEEGKQRVSDFELTASKKEFAYGRILFALTRNEFFGGIGYLDGYFGIIGDDDFDYCVNSVTLANKVAANALREENKLKNLIKVYEIYAFSKALSESSTLQLARFHSENKTRLNSTDVFDIYQTSLEAISYSLQGDASNAVKKWQQYLELKYGQTATLSDYAPGEIRVSLALFSMLKTEDLNWVADKQVVVDLVRKYFLRDIYNAKFELTYLQQFENFETRRNFYNQMISLLAELQEDREVTETLFILLQRRFITPEQASLTRRYRPSGQSKLSPELIQLLDERRTVIDEFYAELGKRENKQRDEIKFLEYLQSMASKSSTEFFPDGTVEEQLLKRNSLVLPKEAQKEVGILDLMMFSTASHGWNAIEATSVGGATVGESTQENNRFSYQPTKAVILYSNLKILDEKIYALEPSLKEIFYNGPISQNNLQESLGGNEVVIFATQIVGLNKLLAFYITKDNFHFVKHPLDEELTTCIEVFKRHLKSQELMKINCQQLLASIFVPNEFIKMPRDPKLVYILNGEIENFPVGAVSLQTSKKVEIPKTKNRNGVTRGINLPEKNSGVAEVTHQLEYIGQKYPIRYTVSLNQFVTKSAIAKFTPQKSLGFWGIGISNFNFSKKKSFPQEFKELRNLSELPQAKEEINAIAMLFPKRDVNLLMGEKATKQNILLLAKKPRPRILSFATHSIGILNKNEEAVALVLSPEGGNFSNMVLTPDEIVDSGLAGEFVLLSACKTNYRSRLFSSWKNSLVSSFLMNGAQAVLASDWLVDDQATKTLMVNLVTEAQNAENMTLSKALQLAVQKMKNTRYHNPYFWASFKVIGE